MNTLATPVARPAWRFARAPGFAFVQRAARRSHSSAWATALIALVLLNLLREVGTTIDASASTPAQFRPLYDFSGLACVMLCQWLCLVPAVLAADEAVDSGSRPVRTYSIAVLAACVVAALLQYPIWFPPAHDFIPFTQREILFCRIERALMMFTHQLLACSLIVFVRVSVRETREADARRNAADTARLDAKRRSLEARLKATQARIEPQFLFDTLARVHESYQTDPAAAGKTLDDLIAYLRAALPHLRDDSSTLARESELVRAYLEIIRARPDERRAVDIRIPDSLASARVPAMMLLPLIEHVLARGRPQAGAQAAVCLDASTRNGRLQIVLAHRGGGAAPAGDEARLQPISERLHALYGGAADLHVEGGPDGARATLEIPHETTDGSSR